MRTLLTLISAFVLAASVGALAPQTASAQGGYDTRRLPDGSYRDSCRDVRLDRDRMTARCRTNNGYYTFSALNLRDCRGGYVENHNGNLVCVGGGYGGGYGGGRDDDRWGNRDLPPGGYRDSCRDFRMDRDTLTAYCRNKDGDWVYSSLELRGCRGGYVENKRGMLVCRR